MNSENTNYIYNYIKYYYFSVEEFRDENYLKDISNRIASSMPNSSFKDGKLDFMINNKVGEKLRLKGSDSFRIFEEVKNYIYLYMNYYKIYNNVSIKNYNILLYEITRFIFSSYDYDYIVSGNCDSDIEAMINDYVNGGNL